MSDDKVKSSERREISRLVFVGCIVIGIGIYLARDNMLVGFLISIGAGFYISRAIIRYRASQQEGRN